MNPRQRRGLLLIALIVVGAVAVFIAVSGYVADINARVGPVGTMVRLTTDVDAYEPLPAEALEVVEVPDQWRPPLALTSVSEVAGRVPAVPLPALTVLEEGDLIPPPTVQEGMRELAILVDAETGVAGKIDEGDVVDIVATREGQEAQPPSAEIVIERAQILSIGTPVVNEEITPSGQFQSGEVVPITFMLEPDDVLRLAWIESFATSVRLALRSPTDDEGLAPPQRVYQPAGVTS